LIKIGCLSKVNGGGFTLIEAHGQYADCMALHLFSEDKERKLRNWETKETVRNNLGQ
jgi:hypothetical protein